MAARHMAAIGGLQDEIFTHTLTALTKDKEKSHVTLRVTSGVSRRQRDLNEQKEEAVTKMMIARNLSHTNAVEVEGRIPSFHSLDKKMALFPGQAEGCECWKKAKECTHTATCTFQLLDASGLVESLRENCTLPSEQCEEAISRIEQWAEMGTQLVWQDVAKLFDRHWYYIKKLLHCVLLQLVPRMDIQGTKRAHADVVTLTKDEAAGYLQVEGVNVDAFVPFGNHATPRLSIYQAKELLRDICVKRGHDLKQMDVIVALFETEKLGHGVLKSRMHKAIRSHAGVVRALPPYLSEDVAAPLFAAACALWLCTLGPKLDPYLARSYTGVESCCRRLAIAMLEDGLPYENLDESLEVIRDLLCITQVCAHNKGYQPPAIVLLRVADWAYSATKSSCVYVWWKAKPWYQASCALQTFKVFKTKASTRLAQQCEILVKKLGGFKSDFDMFDVLLSESEAELRMGITPPPEGVPLLWLTDFHCLPSMLLYGSAPPKQTKKEVWILTGWNYLVRAKPDSPPPRIINAFRVAHSDMTLALTESVKSRDQQFLEIPRTIPPLTISARVGSYKVKGNHCAVSMHGQTLCDSSSGVREEFEGTTFIYNNEETIKNAEGGWGVLSAAGVSTLWPEYRAAPGFMKIPQGGRVLELIESEAPHDIYMDCFGTPRYEVAEDYVECTRFLLCKYGMKVAIMLLTELNGNCGGCVKFTPPSLDGESKAGSDDRDYLVVECFWMLLRIYPGFFTRTRNASRFTLVREFSASFRNLLKGSFRICFPDTALRQAVPWPVIDKRGYRTQQKEKILQLTEVLRVNRAAILGAQFSFGKTKVSLEAVARLGGKILFAAMNSSLCSAIIQEAATVFGGSVRAEVWTTTQNRRTDLEGMFSRCDLVVTTLDSMRNRAEEISETTTPFSLILDEFHNCFNPTGRTKVAIEVAQKCLLRDGVVLVVSATFTDGQTKRPAQQSVGNSWFSILSDVEVGDGCGAQLIGSDLIITGDIFVHRPEEWKLHNFAIDPSMVEEEATARLNGSRAAYRVVERKLMEMIVHLCTEEYKGKKIVVACPSKKECKQLCDLLGSDECCLVTDEHLRRVVVGSGTSGTHNGFTGTNSLASYDVFVYWPFPVDVKTMFQMKSRLQRQESTKPCTIVFVGLEGARVGTLAARQLQVLKDFTDFFAKYGKNMPTVTLPATWEQLDIFCKEEGRNGAKSTKPEKRKTESANEGKAKQKRNSQSADEGKAKRKSQSADEGKAKRKSQSADEGTADECKAEDIDLAHGGIAVAGGPRDDMRRNLSAEQKALYNSVITDPMVLKHVGKHLDKQKRKIF